MLLLNAPLPNPSPNAPISLLDQKMNCRSIWGKPGFLFYTLQCDFLFFLVLFLLLILMLAKAVGGSLGLTFKSQSVQRSEAVVLVVVRTLRSLAQAPLFSFFSRQVSRTTGCIAIAREILCFQNVSVIFEHFFVFFVKFALQI